MLKASVTVLACLSALCSATGTHNNRIFSHQYNKKISQPQDLLLTLTLIEERLGSLEAISLEQSKQSRRMDVIRSQLDRIELSLSHKVERAQMSVQEMEHRLDKLQISVENSLKESRLKLERTEENIGEIAQNLTRHVDSHRHLLEKVSGAYTETWRRGITLESHMRDSLSLINATRRDLVEGIRSLAKIHKESRLHLSTEFRAAMAGRLDNKTEQFSKMQEVLDTQKVLVDSCQRLQQDDPKQVADALDKLVNSMLNKTATTYQELKNIKHMMGGLDSKFHKLVTSRYSQSDQTCKKLETAFRTSFSSIKEEELAQLTEKFIALTDRADDALQKLDKRLMNEEPSDADRLFKRLENIKGENENDDYDIGDSNADSQYSDDDGEPAMMDEDKTVLQAVNPKWKTQWPKPTTTALPHRRHLHRHPYDRGPY